jgi:3-oxoacyl-[acyl-carrier-protein] synthase II
MRRVVVTGLGIVAPTGNDVKTAWDAAVAGRSGIDRITLFDASALPTQIAGEVKNFDIGDAMDLKEAQRASRFVKFATHAARQAIRDSGLNGESAGAAADRWGVSIGVGLGGLQDIEENTLILKEKGHKRVSPFFLPYCIPNMASGVVSRLNHFRGPNICTTTACTSGTHGVGEAYLYIQNGMADVMVAGGAESAISPLGIVSFTSMKALSTRNDDPKTASRPFDKDRDGFVMGEGAGVIVLEEYEHARRRGARIYAEMVGYGMSGDAHHITAPAPEGEGAQRCMKLALSSAKVRPEEIDHINAHGTSTGLNDKYESMAIAKVFGDHAHNISICSTKGVTGHCLGAAGGVEAVYSVLALHHKVVPPTANWQTRDPECPLDYTTGGARERSIRYALSNSFGFGGTNGSILFKSV